MMLPAHPEIVNAPLEFSGKPISTRSVFDDHIWELDAPQATARRIKIDWNISLGRHGCLTDVRFERWLWSCKALIYLMLTGDYGLFKTARSTTVRLCADSLRLLVQWMARTRVFGFDALTLEHVRSYRLLLDNRRTATKSRANRSVTERGLSEARRRHLLHPLKVLIALRDRIPYQPSGEIAEILDILNIPVMVCGSETERLPDEVAIPLFQSALRWLTENRQPLIDAHTILATGERLSKSTRSSDRGRLAARYLRRNLAPDIAIVIGSESRFLSEMRIKDINVLVLLLEAACYIVIAGMVGPRVSEIGSLRPGCLESVPTTRGEDLLLLNGYIFKTSRMREGTPWKWVAGWDGPENPVRMAIETLEALRSAETHQQEFLFIESQGRRDGSADPLTREGHNRRINRFRVANDIGDWELASHQFRKTFARFVTKRDFTGLVALKNHFGHVSIQMTEHYGYWDPDLLQEVLDADVEQDFEALDCILRSSVLGGAMGERIVASNERFRGIAGEEARRLEIESFRNEVSDDPLVVMRNDYGYCIFVEDQAACGGVRWKVGVATCISCPNCVVGREHLPWWKRDAESHQETIDLVTFPFFSDEAQEGVRKSLKTAQSVIARLEGGQANG